MHSRSARIASLLGASLLLGMLTLPTAAVAKTTAAKTEKAASKTASLLFVMHAASGNLTAAASGESSAFDLVLADVAPETMWFADRPARRADTVTTTTALKMIGFGDDATSPNAVIAIHESDPDHDALGVKLADPTYDDAAGTLALKVTVLPKVTKDSALAGYADELDTTLPSSFGNVSLYIDNPDTAVDDVGKPLLGNDCVVTVKNAMNLPGRTINLYQQDGTLQFGGKQDYSFWKGDNAFFGDHPKDSDRTMKLGESKRSYTDYIGWAAQECSGSVNGIMELDGVLRTDIHWTASFSDPASAASTWSCQVNLGGATGIDGSPNDHIPCTASEAQAHGQPFRVTFTFGPFPG
jgi:hypothetical protein